MVVSSQANISVALSAQASERAVFNSDQLSLLSSQQLENAAAFVMHRWAICFILVMVLLRLRVLTELEIFYMVLFQGYALGHNSKCKTRARMEQRIVHARVSSSKFGILMLYILTPFWASISNSQVMNYRK